MFIGLGLVVCEIEALAPMQIPSLSQVRYESPKRGSGLKNPPYGGDFLKTERRGNRCPMRPLVRHSQSVVSFFKDKIDKILPNSEMSSSSQSSIVDDAVSALVSLGYKRQDAEKYVDNLDSNLSTSEEIIREVLKNVLVR